MLVVIVLLAYIIGSIPSAVWVGKYFYGVDVREHGSGNAGATNVLRTLGKKPGIAVLIMDMLKGFAAVNLSWFTDYTSADAEWLGIRAALGVVAILGHIFPLFAGFRGGKGVATMTGTLIALNPVVAVIAIIFFMAVLSLTKYVSVSSMATALMLPVIFGAWFGAGTALSLYSFAVAVILIITHRKNIKRLMKGEESKVGVKKKHDGA
jgi:acyl phosphate:glycerol-3-phosphate acyltransferase